MTEFETERCQVEERWMLLIQVREIIKNTRMCECKLVPDTDTHTQTNTRNGVGACERTNEVKPENLLESFIGWKKFQIESKQE